MRERRVMEPVVAARAMFTEAVSPMYEAAFENELVLVRAMLLVDVMFTLLRPVMRTLLDAPRTTLLVAQM